MLSLRESRWQREPESLPSSPGAEYERCARRSRRRRNCASVGSIPGGTPDSIVLETCRVAAAIRLFPSANAVHRRLGRIPRTRTGRCRTRSASPPNFRGNPHSDFRSRAEKTDQQCAAQSSFLRSRLMPYASRSRCGQRSWMESTRQKPRNPRMYLIVGGATLQRCDNGLLFMVGLRRRDQTDRLRICPVNTQRQTAESAPAAQHPCQCGTKHRDPTAWNETAIAPADTGHSAQNFGCGRGRIVLRHRVTPRHRQQAIPTQLPSDQPVNTEAIIAQNQHHVSGRNLVTHNALNGEQIAWPNRGKHAHSPRLQENRAMAPQLLGCKTKPRVLANFLRGWDGRRQSTNSSGRQTCNEG